MKELLFPLVFLFVPAMVLYYLTVEIYLRNPSQLINRIMALFVLSYSFMFIGYFLANVLPIDIAPLASRYITYSFSFINLTLSLYFIQIFSKFRIHPLLFHASSLLPLVGLVCMLSGSPLYGVSVVSGEVWNHDVRSHSLDLLISIITLYSVIYYSVVTIRSIRKMNRRYWIVLERARIKVFMKGMLMTMLCVILTEFVLKPTTLGNPYFQIEFAIYSIFIYVFSIRYAIFKYDFLSTTSRRYEILFNESSSGIVIFDEEWRFIDANPAILRMIGISGLHDRSWENTSYTDYIIIEDSLFNERKMMTFMMEKTSLQIETRLTNRLQQSYEIDMQINFFEMEGQIWSFVLMKDITAKKNFEQKLAFLAYQDTLTGLANRRSFYEKLEDELLRLEGTDRAFAVLLIDLDQFKWVNDTLGHTTGDKLLCITAKMLLSVVPENCCVARIGGDEFVVLLPDLQSENDAVTLAGALNEKLKEPINMNGLELHISASIGISIAPRDGTHVESIIGGADAAMYGAKKSGRNQFQDFDPSQRVFAQRTFALINGLRNALKNNEFTLYFQPQIDLRTNRLIGVEALLRWYSAELGSVKPDDFIPIAEESGEILQIGEWVLRNAINQGKQWIESGCPDLIMSVNVSARQLKDPEFAGRLADLLREHDFPADRLCLEITESTAIDNEEQSLRLCREIVSLGVKLALDDFGIGYSSLSMLGRFPFQMVKIDKSLIRDIGTNKGDLDVVRTIVLLSNNLGLEVLAEGVETKWQFELLRRFGCSSVQGYLLGRPMPAGEFYASREMVEEKIASQYELFAGIEVIGAATFSVLNGIGAFRSVASGFMEEGGFGVPEPDQWYPLPEWLIILGSVSETLGTEALRGVGKAIPKSAIFPPETNNIEAALASIDIAYMMNHRGEQIELIGHYTYAKTGDRSAKIVCDNPFPCDFDTGIIEAITEKFSDPASIVSIIHDESSCRKNNGKTCTYHITW